MRVLHIGKFFPPVPGGMEVFLRDLMLAQRQQGIDSFAIVHQGHRAPNARESEWLVQVPVWFKILFAPISPTFPLALARAIRALEPDVLHLHLPNPSAFWVLAIPAARRLPWVVHWQSDVVPSKISPALRLAYPFYRPFEQALLDRCAAIIPTSTPYLAASEPLSRWHEKCSVIPLGVDLKRLPESKEEQHPPIWQVNVFRILAIGRLTYYKGFDTLIRAVARLPGTQLLIVGNGDDYASLAALIRQEHAADHIQLLSEVEDATRNGLLASCDVLCLPSRERTEAFGIVLMEAMRYGKPVIASKVPGSGMSWVVDEGKTGLLAAPEEVSAWRASIVRLAEAPDFCRQLGEEAARQFARRFSIDTVSTKITRLYNALLDIAPGSALKETPLIVIPAQNEADSIGKVIVTLQELGYSHILVVNDNSQDHTAEIARGLGAVVLSPPIPLGAWGAMQTGLRYAQRQGYGHVVTMDADGQHEPAYIPALLAAGRSHDVVIGAYPQRGSLLRQWAWKFFRALTGFGIEDLTSGFRYYNAAACAVLADEEATLLDYQDVGVLLLLRRAGFSFVEVPVEMYLRANGPSRIFSSWGRVGRYMLETTLLCLAHWHPRHFKRSFNPPSTASVDGKPADR